MIRVVGILLWTSVACLCSLCWYYRNNNDNDHVLVNQVLRNKISILQQLDSPLQAELPPASTSSSKPWPSATDLLASNYSYSYDNYLYAMPEKLVASEREYNLRKEIFESNLQWIRMYNTQQQRATNNKGHLVGLNEFSDRFPHELPQRGYDKSHHDAWNQNPIDGSVITKSDARVSQKHEMDYWSLLGELTMELELPKQVDWRMDGTTGKPLVTPVKNQGTCGSCWAFASTAAIESHVAMASNNIYNNDNNATRTSSSSPSSSSSSLISLSVQELVSCVPNPNHCGGTGGCGGSTAELALDFVRAKGLVDEWHFGYQSFDGRSENPVPCTLKQPQLHDNNNNNHDDNDDNDRQVSKYLEDAIVTVQGYAKLPSNNYTALMHAVAKHGPVIVNVASHTWHFYESGVFAPKGHAIDQTDIDHVVVLMGYGTDDSTGEDYWLIRNSYGPLWGEDGYIRLKRVDPQTLPQPDADCGMDVRPADGIACTIDEHQHHIKPPAVKVCGTSGILFDPIVPIGARVIA